jgi:SAM-dependent methyltransferase
MVIYSGEEAQLMVDVDHHRNVVKERYAQLAIAAPPQSACCGQDSSEFSDPHFGAALYEGDDAGCASAEALAMSLGCGNPMLVADLHPGDRVVDLGSGGGLDVILSAKRVGPEGFAYGIDMTQEMLDAARANAAKADVGNVEFRLGFIEDLPLDDASVDVVISNCVLNLSADKPQVLREVFRVLVPGGRVGICDVVANVVVPVEERVRIGQGVGCVAGALSRSEYLSELAAAGFTDTDVTFTHQVAQGMNGATIRALKPAH